MKVKIIHDFQREGVDYIRGQEANFSKADAEMLRAAFLVDFNDPAPPPPPKKPEEPKQP